MFTGRGLFLFLTWSCGILMLISTVCLFFAPELIKLADKDKSYPVEIFLFGLFLFGLIYMLTDEIESTSDGENDQDT